MKTILIAAALLLSGCSSIHTYVQDWPELKTRIHTIPDGDIYATCSKDLSWVTKYVLVALPLACAHINLPRKTCDIYVTETTTGPSLDHELAHCKGGDHGGISQAFFDRWKSKQHLLARKEYLE
jgi:uncharacterized protein YceK